MIDQQNQFPTWKGACKVLLQELLANWPKPDCSEPADFRRRLAPYLSETFNEVDLLNRVTAVRTWGSSRASSDGLILDFSDSEGSLQRAVFISDHGRGWQLQSMKFQCPACFGTGKNDGKVCAMCGGLGWGAS